MSSISSSLVAMGSIFLNPSVSLFTRGRIFNSFLIAAFNFSATSSADTLLLIFIRMCPVSFKASSAACYFSVDFDPVCVLVNFNQDRFISFPSLSFFPLFPTSFPSFPSPVHDGLFSLAINIPHFQVAYLRARQLILSRLFSISSSPLLERRYPFLFGGLPHLRLDGYRGTTIAYNPPLLRGHFGGHGFLVVTSSVRFDVTVDPTSNVSNFSCIVRFQFITLGPPYSCR